MADAGVDENAEAVIHAAYIDWVNGRPGDLKVAREEGIENIGQFVLRQLHRVGYRVVDSRVRQKAERALKEHDQEAHGD